MANKNTTLSAEILQRHFSQFLLAIGNSTPEMSERAAEYLTAVMIEYADSRLSDFCDYLSDCCGSHEGLYLTRLDEFKLKIPK